MTDSTVMRSKQIFFTLSPDGLTQFSLDSTVFIDLHRWAGGRRGMAGEGAGGEGQGKGQEEEGRGQEEEGRGRGRRLEQ